MKVGVEPRSRLKREAAIEWSETVPVAAELEESVLTTGAFLYRAYGVMREVAAMLRISEERRLGSES